MPRLQLSLVSLAQTYESRERRNEVQPGPRVVAIIAGSLWGGGPTCSIERSHRCRLDGYYSRLTIFVSIVADLLKEKDTDVGWNGGPHM